MNSVHLIGRLTKDPELLHSEGSGTPYCRLSIAIDRGKGKDGKDLGTDFPSVIAFGKTAENISNYCSKGRLVAVEARVRTETYEKDGQKKYEQSLVIEHVHFLEAQRREAQ